MLSQLQDVKMTLRNALHNIKVTDFKSLDDAYLEKVEILLEEIQSLNKALVRAYEDS